MPLLSEGYYLPASKISLPKRRSICEPLKKMKPHIFYFTLIQTL